MSCYSDDDCNENAECVYDFSSLDYTCKCGYGFHGDASACIPDGCNIINNCHPSAECQCDERYGTCFCQCLDVSKVVTSCS